MLPTIAGFSSWMLLAGVATIVALGVGMTHARRLGVEARLVTELAVVVVAGGWLSAKIGHVLFEARGHALPGGQVADGIVSLWRADPWHWARLLEPGYVQLAGLLGAVGLGVVFLIRQGAARSIPALADVAAVAVMTGVGIGRVGCFLAGCCFGAATDVPWAVHFPADHVTAGAGVHPTQLYDVAVAVMAIGLWLFVRHRPARSGVAAVVVAAFFVTARIGTETLRADPERGSFGPLSTSQALGLGALFALSAVAHMVRRRRLDAAAQTAIVSDTPGRG